MATKKKEDQAKKKVIVVEGSVTAPQKEAWKKKYGKNLRSFELQDGERKYVAYFSKPTLDQIHAAESEHPDDMIDRNLFIFENCFLGGADAFKDEDEYRFALANGIARTFRMLVGQVKNV